MRRRAKNRGVKCTRAKKKCVARVCVLRKKKERRMCFKEKKRCAAKKNRQKKKKKRRERRQHLEAGACFCVALVAFPNAFSLFSLSFFILDVFDRLPQLSFCAFLHVPNVFFLFGLAYSLPLTNCSRTLLYTLLLILLDQCSNVKNVLNNIVALAKRFDCMNTIESGRVVPASHLFSTKNEQGSSKPLPAKKFSIPKKKKNDKRSVEKSKTFF
jgi:hypothetical protein